MSAIKQRRQPYACFLVLVFTFSILGVDSCSAEDNKRINELVIRMGSFSKAVDYAPYLVAKRQHLFEQAVKSVNGRVTYEVFQSLPSLNEAMASNKVDFVFEAEVPAIVGKAADIGLRIIAISARCTPQILVHKNSGLKKVADLRGKRIAVLAGTGAHYGLWQTLKRAGLSKNEMAVVDMTPPDARSAFNSQKIDAWCIWSPFAEQEEIAGAGIALPNVNAGIDSIMVVRDALAIERPKIVKSIVAALEKAKQWVLANPTAAQKIVADEYQFPLAVVKLSWSRLNWRAQLTESVCKDMQDKADFLKSVGFVHKRVLVHNGLIDRSFQTTTK